MLLGFNSNGLQNHRLADGLRVLADSGYEWLALTPDVCHLDPFTCRARDVDAIATLLQSLQMGVSIETGARFVLDPMVKHEPTLMTPDPERVAARVAFTRRCAEIGRDLGAEVVSFWAGVDRSPDATSERRLLDGVRATVEAVRELGMVPAFEPEPGMAVETLAAFDAMCAELGDAAPRLCLDVGHLYVTEEEDPVVSCRRVAAGCAQVHLEDIRRGVHEHLVPGEGEVDFAAVLDALRAGGYQGPICFELSRASHRATDALRRCRDVWEAWRSGRA